LEVQFNQSDCNFVMHSAQEDSLPSYSNLHGQVIQDTSSLTLFTNRWMRLTHEVKSGTIGIYTCHDQEP
jgi:trafficking protein particle complex subunit 11